MLTALIETQDATTSQVAHPAASHALEVMSGTVAGEETYSLATFMLRIVDKILMFFGLENNPVLVTWIYAAVVLGVSMVVGYVAKWIILAIAERVGRRWSPVMYGYLKQEHFFHKVCRMIPALVFLIFIEFTLVVTKTFLASLLIKITLIYVIYVTIVSLTALARSIWLNVDERKNKKHLPLKGLVQLVTGILWIIGIICAIAVIVDKSPGSLLAGLGAVSAVLMLVFKDSILGLVAGVQLSEDDSLHVGDWVKINGTDANGTVMEVNLTSVKIQNWDKTTTMVPPYSLISGSFTNYTSMQRSNTRRICRTIMIDADSVLPATDEMISRVRKLPYMEEWISAKLEQKAAGNVMDVNNTAGLVNGTIDTNLGMFRAYMRLWLKNSKFIDQNSDCFVSTLQQTNGGIPFQIYAFTNTSAWFAYEAMQDTIFEHAAAMLTVFGLYFFENPSGRDTVVDGYLSPGRNITEVFGIPEPFFRPGVHPTYAASQSAQSTQSGPTSTPSVPTGSTNGSETTNK